MLRSTHSHFCRREQIPKKIIDSKVVEGKKNVRKSDTEKVLSVVREREGGWWSEN